MSIQSNNKKLVPKKYSVEEKIKIFEEFKKTGEEITGKTVFNGYPIGQWGIQIRNLINKSKGEKKYIKITEEQMVKLKELGILERQKDSMIDEKIQDLKIWMEKYPKAKVSRDSVSEGNLKQYATSNEDYEKLLEEYKKMQNHYAYIRDRRSKGKLPTEKEKECKEANIGGVFGFSTQIENLAKRFGLKEKQVEYLLDNYGSIKHFVKLYRNGKLKGDDLSFAKETIKNAFALDENIYSDNYDNLVNDLVGNSHKNLTLYSIANVQDLLKILTPREYKVIETRYGLKDGNAKNLEDTGKEIKVTRERARQVEAKAFRKLRHNSGVKKAIYNYLKENELVLDEEVSPISALEQDIENSNLIFKTVDKKNWDINKEVISQKAVPLEKLKEELEKRKYLIEEEKRKKNRRMLSDSSSINELGLTVRAYNCLYKFGIRTVGEARNLNDDELKKIENLGKKTFSEIKEKLSQIISEKEEATNDKSVKNPEPSELEKLRTKRDELQEIVNQQKEKTEQAQALLDQCSKILGESKEKSNHDFKDGK